MSRVLSEIPFKAKGLNTLPLFPDHVWENIISFADLASLPKLCLVNIMFYYFARRHISLAPDIIHGYWGLVFGTTNINHFASGNLEMKNEAMLGDGISSLHKGKIAAVGCSMKYTLSVNQFFYVESSKFPKRVAIMLVNMRYNPRNRFSFFEGVFASVFTQSLKLVSGHIAGVKMREAHKEHLEDNWDTIMDSITYVQYTQAISASSEFVVPKEEILPEKEKLLEVEILPEIEKEGMAKEWGEREAYKFLVNKFPVLEATWKGIFMEHFTGEWQLCLDIGEKHVELNMTIVDVSPYATKAVIRTMKRSDKKEEEEVEGIALICVNELGVIGISASFQVDSSTGNTEPPPRVLSAIGEFHREEKNNKKRKKEDEKEVEKDRERGKEEEKETEKDREREREREKENELKRDYNMMVGKCIYRDEDAFRGTFVCKKINLNL